MVNKVHSIFISLFAIVVTLYCGCSNEAPIVGGSSQQGNGMVAGMVVDTSGKSAAHVRVTLLPALYDPVKDSSSSDTLIDTTDDKGCYSIKGISAGNYTIMAFQELTGLKALITDITIAPSEAVSVKQATLKGTGCIKVDFPDTFTAINGYVYLPGTTSFGLVTDRHAIIDFVPTAEIPSVNYATGTGSSSTVIRYNLRVNSGDTVTIFNPAWKYSRRLFLNTTSTGANVPGNVINFPVLVRLTANTYDFTQARIDGEDILFTTSGGSPLACEIERWDPVKKLAEVWVKIDTVFGNDSDQSIIMYWGNPAPSLRYASGSVFDTVEGFQGVWHLGDNADDSVCDATVNRYHGISSDASQPSIAEGIIGNCRVFDGNGTYITMPNTASGKLDFPQNGHFSVSAWVMADTFIDLQQTLVSKGKYQYFLWIDSTSWQFWEFQNRAGWEASAQQATLKQWVLLTGMRDGAIQRLYVNGEPVDSISIKPDITPRNTASDLILGRSHEITATSDAEAGFCSFRGKIDEVRIISAALSADWARLCYMNQRFDDRLIVYK
jgi:hypothetical protein